MSYITLLRPMYAIFFFVRYFVTLTFHSFWSSLNNTSIYISGCCILYLLVYMQLGTYMCKAQTTFSFRIFCQYTHTHTYFAREKLERMWTGRSSKHQKQNKVYNTFYDAADVRFFEKFFFTFSYVQKWMPEYTLTLHSPDKCSMFFPS